MTNETPFWLISHAVMDDICKEARDAHVQHGYESMLYGSDSKALRILLEEVGEVAKAMNELALGNITRSGYHAYLRAELIQVAAMAATWIEKLATYPDYSSGADLH